MSDKSHDSLILDLVNLLAGKQVDTQSIHASLELICGQFSFDCGLIYEIDQYNRFSLKEHCLVNKTSLPESFSVDAIKADYREYLSQEIVSYIEKRAHNTPDELSLMQFFSADHLAVSTVVDENTRIQGFILFLNKQTGKTLSERDQKSLSVMLGMLGRYLGIRIYQNKLRFSKHSLESILDNTGIDIYVNDFYTHEILYANQSMAAPYGGLAQFLGKKCWQTLYPDKTGPCDFCPQKKLIDEEGNPTRIYSWDYQRPFDGAWFRVFSAAFRWIDGRLAHVVSSADITENKRNEELISYMANYDTLTGLPNRRMLIGECDRRIKRTGEGDTGYLLFFDLDGFKSINDSYGHDAGDEFLVKLGEFFTEIPMLKNAIYRNGGDEFVAVIDGIAKWNNSNTVVTKKDIKNLAHLIHERFKKPWHLEKGSVYCNTSIGVACYPEDGTTPEELLHKADSAMYEVKKAGGGGLRFAKQVLK